MSGQIVDVTDVATAGVPESLRQEVTFHLEPPLHEFLSREAVRRGVDPSTVLVFAVGLLALYVDDTVDGNAVVLGPITSAEGEPTTFEMSKVPVSPGRIADLFGVPTEEVRMGGWDDDPVVQLHLVRETDA